MNSTDNQIPNRITDKVATYLANQIIRAKYYLAQSLNQWFNAYPAPLKKKILVAAGLLFSIVLVGGAFSSTYTMPGLSQNFTSAHIGQSSDLPKPKFYKRQLIDSLTIKK
jgi:hypothetical protein